MKKRRGAFLVKNVDMLFPIVMAIMPRRYDATNYTFVDVDCEAMDKYIAKKKEEGEKYNYMHLMIAAMIRTFAMRPNINRYTMNCRLYERYKIDVSFMIKQALRDESPEITIKHQFNGNETLKQVKDILEDIISTNLANAGRDNETQKTASKISSLPVGLAKLVVGFLRWSDRHNIMPKAFEDISPFHTSFFITNLKSIKTDTIIHHCYDFGTTSLFMAMGKEKLEPVVDENHNIVARKRLKLGISVDERICDGLYYGKSFHLLKRLLNNPEMLETEYHDAKIDAEIEKDRILAEKEAKKQAKIDAKKAKKASKKH